MEELNKLNKKVKKINWKEISSMPLAGHHYPNCRYCNSEATHMAVLNSSGFAPLCEGHARERFSAVKFGLNVHCEQDIRDSIERERAILEKIGKEPEREVLK